MDQFSVAESFRNTAWILHPAALPAILIASFFRSRLPQTAEARYHGGGGLLTSRYSPGSKSPRARESVTGSGVCGGCALNVLPKADGSASSSPMLAKKCGKACASCQEVLLP